MVKINSLKADSETLSYILFNYYIKGENKNITIELPIEDDKTFKSTYRVNRTINEQFKEFCKEHKEFTAKDLLSQALKEFMDRYNK